MSVYDPLDFPFKNGDFLDWAPKLFNMAFSGYFDMSYLTVKKDVIHTCPFYIGSDKTVLIVGGGPSTLLFNDYASYDYVWSMNAAWKVIPDKICLLGVGAGVNIDDEEFRKFSHGKVLAFEIHPRWFHNDSLTKYEKCSFAYHTNIYGKIGMGVRLINLAASLGAKHISFIGLDGPEAIIQGNHAFEPGKTDLPSFCTRENAYDVHKKQYDYFWDYIQKLYPDVMFHSLDKTNKLHEKILSS